MDDVDERNTAWATICRLTDRWSKMFYWIFFIIIPVVIILINMTNGFFQIILYDYALFIFYHIAVSIAFIKNKHSKAIKWLLPSLSLLIMALTVWIFCNMTYVGDINNLYAKQHISGTLSHNSTYLFSYNADGIASRRPKNHKGRATRYGSYIDVVSIDKRLKLSCYVRAVDNCFNIIADKMNFPLIKELYGKNVEIEYFTVPMAKKSNININLISYMKIKETGAELSSSFFYKLYYDQWVRDSLVVCYFFLNSFFSFLWVCYINCKRSKKWH